MPAISERVARWVARVGIALLVLTVAAAIVRRWGRWMHVAWFEIAGIALGALLAVYGSAVCAWWRREQRRREREEFERLLEKGANRYS